MNFLTKLLIVFPILFFLNAGSTFGQVPEKYKIVFHFDQQTKYNTADYPDLICISDSSFLQEAQINFKNIGTFILNFDYINLNSIAEFGKPGENLFESLLDREFSSLNKLTPEEIFLSRYYDKTSDMKYIVVSPILLGK